jgi:actin-related protein
MPEKNIVLDNGSGFIKAGFAGENLPSIEFPTIIGFPRN